MSSLFGKKRKRPVVQKGGSQTSVVTKVVKSSASFGEDDTVVSNPWQALGLSKWVWESCSNMGLSTPTPVQVNCIPAIMNGRDILGCAPTGSGKTAAFALPILKCLSDDPFGIYAVVLTPTRELAMQIVDQFNALGSKMKVRVCTIIGGMDMLKQSLELQKRPHVVVATPGRLRDHLTGPRPPSFNKARFLVLDEADRMLTSSFVKDLKVVLKAMETRKQTLLFSATLSKDIVALQSLAMTDPYQFDATPSITTVKSLKQFYLFIPAQVKSCYLYYLLKTQGPYAHRFDSEGKLREDGGSESESDEDEYDMEGSQKRKTSAIIFTSTCKACQELCETLIELGIPCVALHSMMTQHRRIAALGKFKSSLVRVLVCTDVASRGLDIPSVELVVNYHMPRSSDDYIHRVGRTARAGRGGQAVSIVSQVRACRRWLLLACFLLSNAVPM
jgi:ATP-dependent RNA helicase DDX49/DBP8